MGQWGGCCWGVVETEPGMTVFVKSITTTAGTAKLDESSKVLSCH